MKSEPQPGATAPWPLEIRRHRATGDVSLAFDNGEEIRLPGPLLRAASPSASERGHGGSSEDLLPGDFAGVSVLKIFPVGAYAVRLVFSDGHDTGLYTFDRLYRLGAAAWPPPPVRGA